VVDLKTRDQTVHDRLAALAEEHGLHATRALTLRFDGEGGLARITARMAGVRRDLPATLGGRAVEQVRDLLDDPWLPVTDALLFSLDGGSRVVMRPSGTEPKLKCYLEVVAPVAGDLPGARRRADAALTELTTDLDQRLSG